MLTAVEGLVTELRQLGVPVPVSAVVDAARAMTHVDVLDRGAVRVALRAVLVKDAGHLTTFDTVFDTFFALQEPADDDGSPRHGASGGFENLDDDTLRDLLAQALRDEDAPLLRALVRVLVDRHGAVNPARPQDVGYNLYRALRMIDSTEVMTRLAAGSDAGHHEHAHEHEHGHGHGHGAPSEVAQLAAEAHAQTLGLAVETEIRRRLVVDRGADDVARTLRTPLPENMAFLGASALQVAAMRGALRPLARSLAAQMAEQRRRRGRGALDVRRTVRSAMSTGGVPVTPVFRRPHPAKPQLVVLADISGSVSTFATFTLQLIHALRSEFTSIRSFAFVDGIEEVTDLIDRAGDPTEIARRLNEAGAGVWLDGRSDYGNALAGFAERFTSQLTRRTTVLVLGDARGNDHEPRSEALAAVRRAAGAVHWLNPEPRESWNTGDSDIGLYAEHCDTVVECRTLRDLRAFTERLATARVSSAPRAQPPAQGGAGLRQHRVVEPDHHHGHSH